MPAAGPGHPGAIRLARRILDLASRSAWPVGRHVTEAELVGALGVSRTPVRGALRLLARESIVEARPNQGFFLLRDGAELAGFDLDVAPTPVERLYGAILRDRIAGSLPRDVTQAVLASRYGAGRSLLDQALARLADDGLLLRGEGRAWTFVDSLTDQGSVQASYLFRIVVEPAGLLSPDFRMSREAVARLRERHDALVVQLDDAASSRDWARAHLRRRTLIVRLDADFHETLAGFSGNPFMIAAVRQQVALRRLLEFGIEENRAHVAKWCREHLAILSAIDDGETGRAADLLRGHLARASRDAITAIARTRR